MSEPVPARPSATVMITRDGAAGLEVFMVVRDRQVDFASGAAVFPGGKLEPDDDVAAGDIPVPAPDRAYWIGAIRETFEESGLLIARHGASGAIVDAATARSVAAGHRSALLDGTRAFSTILEQSGLIPATDLMAPFAHWVTPVNSPKRFDTHFFLIAALPGQHAEHDGREAVQSFWARPGDLIAEAMAGRQTLVPATELNLELLAESATVAEALAAARARRIVTVMPEMRRTPEGMHIRFAADAGYRRHEMLIRR
jgi:8-oxo-dGTP pyrophosphatase MutT (NUDIX family)